MDYSRMKLAFPPKNLPKATSPSNNQQLHSTALLSEPKTHNQEAPLPRSKNQQKDLTNTS
jgi:hypothetical protein